METLIDFSSGNMMNFIIAMISHSIIFQTNYDRWTQLTVLRPDDIFESIMSSQNWFKHKYKLRKNILLKVLKNTYVNYTANVTGWGRILSK